MQHSERRRVARRRARSRALEVVRRGGRRGSRSLVIDQSPAGREQPPKRKDGARPRGRGAGEALRGGRRRIDVVEDGARLGGLGVESSLAAVLDEAFDEEGEPGEAGDDAEGHEDIGVGEDGFWVVRDVSEDVDHCEGHEDAAAEGEGRGEGRGEFVVEGVVVVGLAHLPGELEGVGGLGEDGGEGDHGPARVGDDREGEDGEEVEEVMGDEDGVGFVVEDVGEFLDKVAEGVPHEGEAGGVVGEAVGEERGASAQFEGGPRPAQHANRPPPRGDRVRERDDARRRDASEGRVPVLGLRLVQRWVRRSRKAQPRGVVQALMEHAVRAAPRRHRPHRAEAVVLQKRALHRRQQRHPDVFSPLAPHRAIVVAG
mmetsp:Transcript_15558/g.48657  ORF Transcript_15558/g.48657 Transcript_15558/m.48657 type:complete len:371 (-) Transcript_15558:8-1120(-)